MLAQLLIFLAFSGADPSWTIVESGVTTSIRGISANNGQRRTSDVVWAAGADGRVGVSN
jgi:hypothetical protein